MCVLIGLLVGCTASSGSDSGGTGKFGSSSADDSSGGTEDDDTLPALDDSVEDPGGCEEVLGEALAGAASMFYGEYHDQGDGTWSGEERFLIWANATWRAAGGADCEVRWTATAVETTAPSCTGCDLGLSTTLILDEGATTCDLDIVGGADGTASYGVARHSGGDATWYFATTKERFGDGQHIDGAANFLTDPSCRWW
jgi:hypothetical protein